MNLPTLALLALAVLAPVAQADEPAPGPTLLGRWAVDTARLPMAAAARPRSVTITFSAVGSDRIRTQVEVVAPGGERLVADGVTPLDGTPTRVPANFEADVSATTMPRPEVLVMQLAQGGQPASTRIYAVQAGGATMVETVAHFSASGEPVLRQNHFSRVQ